MADPAQFSHDRLGHLLSDRLLSVPRFQRRYSWEEEHLDEYWKDIERARAANNAYFMGTIVLASDPENENSRKLIIDGQQRIITTAILLIAIRDRLRKAGQTKSAQSVEDTHLSDYVLEEEKDIAKLTLSSSDHPSYSGLLAGEVADLPTTPVVSAYYNLRKRVDELCPDDADYRRLIELVSYLNSKVQVLLAVATGLAEAYVIFETLNDRGADLITADLLKNYLFSEAEVQGIAYAESAWTRLDGRLDRPEDLVKFLRYEYMSRNGHVTNRGLYKALQHDIGVGSRAVTTYVKRLESTLSQYIALKEPDDASWSSQSVEVKDSLLALRRFGFEASMPLLLAAFSTWNHTEATRFVDVVTSWSVRALMAGNLGGGVAEKTFCEAAKAVTAKTAKSVDDVRVYMKDLVPEDSAFRQAFLAYGSITTTRAKYLFAKLEKQLMEDGGEQTDAMPDWSSKSVSVEHIFARSSKATDFGSPEEYEKFIALKDQLQNLTLLERTLNGELDNKPFAAKRDTYEKSKFGLTKQLSRLETWDFNAADERANELAGLAVKAWPR